MSDKLEMITTKYSLRDGGHYTPGVKYMGMLFISGQLSIDPETGRPPEGGVKQETVQALSNLERVLKEAGATKEDVIQCRVYIPDIEYWGELNDVYSEFFGAHKPARVIVPSNKLFGGCKVEIEAVAVCP